MERASPHVPATTESCQEPDSDHKQREQALERVTKLALQTVDELNKQESEQSPG